jgi:hypothetical protein
MSLGEAFVEAFASTDGFLEKLEKDLKEILAKLARTGEPQVTVFADVSKFRNDLVKKLKAELSGFSEGIFVNPDTDLFHQELVEGVNTAMVGITASVPIFAELSPFLKEMKALQAIVTATVDPIAVPIRPDTDGFIALVKTELAALAKAFINIPVRPIFKASEGYKGFAVEVREGIAKGKHKLPVPVIPKFTAGAGEKGFTAQVREFLAKAKFKVEIPVVPKFTGAKGEKGFRAQITEYLATIKSKLTIPVLPDLAGFKAAVEASIETLKTQGIRIPIVPGNLTEFRALVRAALLAEKFPVQIVPVGAAAAGAAAGSAAAAAAAGAAGAAGGRVGSNSIGALRGQVAALAGEVKKLAAQSLQSLSREVSKLDGPLNNLNTLARDARAEMARIDALGTENISRRLRRLRDDLRKLAAASADAAGKIQKDANLTDATLRARFGGALDKIAKDFASMDRNAEIPLRKIQDEADRVARLMAARFGTTAERMGKVFFRARDEIARALGDATSFGLRDAEVIRQAMERAAASMARDFAGTSRSAQRSFREMARAAEIEAYKIQAAMNRAANGGSSAFTSLGTLMTKIFKSVERSFVNLLTNLPQNFLKATALIGAGFLALDAAIAGFGIKAASDLQVAEVQLRAFNFAQFGDQATEGLSKAAKSTFLFANEAEIAAKAASRTAEEIAKLRQIAIETAFDLPTLTDGVRQLQLLQGRSGEQLFDFEGATTAVETLGDAIVVATGKIDNAKLQQVLLPISQAAAAGRFLGQDLNQLAQRLPGVFNRGKLFTQIAESLTTSTKEAKKLKEELNAGTATVPFEKTLAVLLENLAAVPGAAGAARRAVDETLAGTFESLKERIKLSLADAFTDLLPTLQEALPRIGDALDKAFKQVGPSIKVLVTDIVSSLDTIIPALTRATVAVNQVFGGLFRQFGPALTSFFNSLTNALPGIIDLFRDIANSLAPAIPALKDIAAAVALLTAASLRGFATTLGTIGQILAPLAESFKVFAAIIYEISQSDVGELLFTIVGALLAIKAAIIVTTAIQGLATALFATATAATAAGAGLATFRAGLVAAAGPLGVLAVATLAVNEALSKLNVTMGAGELLDTAKGFFAGIGDAAINATQGLGTAVAEALTLGKADTKGFNDELDKLNDKMVSIGQTAKDNLQDIKVAPDIAKQAVEGLDAFRKALTDLPTQADSKIELQTETALARIAVLQKGLDAIPDKKSTEFAVAAERARNEIALTLQQLDAIPELKEVLIQVNVKTIRDDAGRTAVDRLKLLNQGIDPDTISPAEEAARAQQAELDKVVAKLNKSAGDVVGGKGGSKSKAETEAERIAKRFAEAIKGLVKELDRSIRQDLLTGTAESINSTLTDLRNKIIDIFADAGKDVPSGLLRRIRLDNKTLQALAKERDRILDELKAAQDKFSQTRDAALAFGGISGVIQDATEKLKAVSSTLKQQLNVTTLDVAGSFQIIRRRTEEVLSDSGTVDKVKLTTESLVEAFRSRLKVLRDFRRDITALATAGLDKEIIDDLVTQGPEAAGEAADVIRSGGKDLVTELNKLQTDLEAEAKGLGAVATDSLFRQGEGFARGVIETLRGSRDAVKAAITKLVDGLLADIKAALTTEKKVDVGVDIVDGIVQGLKKKSPAVRAEIRALIDSLVKEVEDRLQIKSPSRVFSKLFGYVGAGAVKGIRASLPDMKAAGQSMADAVSGIDLPTIAAPTLGKVDTSSLSALADVEAKMKLDGLKLPTVDIDMVRRVQHDVQLKRDAAAAGPDYGKLESIMAMARSQTIHHTPITQNFPVAVEPTKAVIDVGRIRGGR